MRIPLVGGSGPARSPDADAERSINCYVEMDQGNPRAPSALYGMPGMLLVETMGGGPIRGSIQCDEYTYFVSGSQVFRRWLRDPAVQLNGSMLTSTGPVVMATNGKEILIADGVSNRTWYTNNPTPDTLPTNTLLQSGPIEALVVVKGIAWMNSYWIAWGDSLSSDEDNQQFFWRVDTPGTEWNGLDFASVERDPDPLLVGVPSQGQMWFVGTHSAEIFTSVPDADQPFQRAGASFISHGTVAPQTVCAFDNAMVWLTRDRDGFGMFIRTQGGPPARFSDHKVESALRKYSRVDDAIAFTFQMEGHSFYVCSFPTADATWVYDAASGAWAEWLWRNPADGSLHRHRAANHVLTAIAGAHVFGDPRGGQHLVGDHTTGKVYELRMDVYTDAGDPILLQRRAPSVTDEMALLTMQELRIDMETGVANADAPDPKVQVRIYRDGRTPSAWKEKSLGLQGEHAKPVKFTNLGQGRAFSVELQILAPVKRAIFGAYAWFSKHQAQGRGR